MRQRIISGVGLWLAGYIAGCATIYTQGAIIGRAIQRASVPLVSMDGSIPGTMATEAMRVLENERRARAFANAGQVRR